MLLRGGGGGGGGGGRGGGVWLRWRLRVKENTKIFPKRFLLQFLRGVN